MTRIIAYGSEQLSAALRATYRAAIGGGTFLATQSLGEARAAIHQPGRQDLQLTVVAEYFGSPSQREQATTLLQSLTDSSPDVGTHGLEDQPHGVIVANHELQLARTVLREIAVHARVVQDRATAR